MKIWIEQLMQQLWQSKQIRVKKWYRKLKQKKKLDKEWKGSK